MVKSSRAPDGSTPGAAHRSRTRTRHDGLPRKPRPDAVHGGLTIPATQREACMFQWLKRLDHLFPIRYSVWALCAIGLLASAAAWHRMGTSLWLVVVFLVLVLLGVRDVWQSQHSVLRNYP